MRNLENKARMETWSVQSPEEPGFHAVITPDKSECREEYIYRLNLPKGESYTLSSGKLELHPVLIEGAAKLSGHAVLNETMKQFDAFYIRGGEGAWTSWPPHQHEKDLEEVYCYFGMPLPHFGFHISYLKSGEVEDIVTHTVHSGTMVEAPVGYHPTVASPGTRNSYLWVLAAHSHSSRSYNLAVLDPALENFNSAR